VKSAVLRPLTYAAIVAALLLWRVGDWFIRRGRTIPAAAKTQSASAKV
jgi:hypothetical protein